MFDWFNRKKVKELKAENKRLTDNIYSCMDEIYYLRSAVEELEDQIGEMNYRKREADVKSFVENRHTNTRATK